MSKTVFKLTWPDVSIVSKSAFGIVSKLRKAGFEAYLTGGAVRDALLKRPFKEIDIATSAKPAQVEKLFPKTIPTGKKHGTITVRLKNINFEVTTFRLEGKYENYRRPLKVKFIQDAEQDAKRRDFTINALFYDTREKVVIDYVNGIADLSHKKIRFIGDPNDRIREDALRMLRAVRFANTLNFGISRDSQKAIHKNTNLIKQISAERVKQEFDRILMSQRPAVGFGLLDIVGLLSVVLPEIKALQGVKQPRNQHAEGDVFAHTLLALENFDESYDISTRYAVLFHDIGKVLTREIKKGRTTFHTHQNVGADLARKICSRWKFSSRDTEKITWLVKNHMVPNDFSGMRIGRRRTWGLNPFFKDLLRVYLADARASLHPDGSVDKNPFGYREGLKILKDLQENKELQKPLLNVKDVMMIV